MDDGRSKRLTILGAGLVLALASWMADSGEWQLNPRQPPPPTPSGVRVARAKDTTGVSPKVRVMTKPFCPEARPTKAPPASRDGTLLVVVIHENSGRPLPGVAVFLTPASGQDPLFSKRTLHTGPDGTLRITALPPGPLRVGLDRGAERTVNITPGATTRLRLRVPVGITVRGRVRDAARRLVGGAQILLLRNTTRQRSAIVTTTDDGGEFLLEEISGTAYLGPAQE